MTERTLRTYAKELAGAFYEGTRSGRFRAGMDVPVKTLVQDSAGNPVEVTVVKPFHEAFPDAKSYIKGHWPLFYAMARRQLTAMLGMPTVHQNLKDAIMKALVEDREQQLRQEAKGRDLPDLHGQAATLENTLDPKRKKLIIEA